MVNANSNCILVRMFKVTKYFFIASILVFATSMFFAVKRDIANLQDGRCCDLKKRIVGARYQAAGLSPYFFKWQPGDPERLCNPYESGPQHKPNVVTLPPSCLWLMQPLAKMPFPKIETTWLVVQYLGLLTILGFFLYHIRSFSKRTMLLIAFSIFLFAKGWIINIDIGQNYIIFPAILAAGYCIFYHKGNRFLYAGMLLALCCWLRPNFVLFALPFLAGSYRKEFLKGALLMGTAALLQVVLTGQWSNWVEFVQSSGIWMDYYSQLGGNLPGDFANVIHPASIEGQTDFSVTKLPDVVSNVPIALTAVSGIRLPSFVYTIILISAVLAICVAIYRKSKLFNYQQYWLAGFFCYYLGELLVAVPRNSYYFAELLFPLCLLISTTAVRRNISLYLAFAGLLLATLVVKVIPMQLLVAEYAIALAILVKLVSAFNDKGKPAVQE
jgi:Glycosyltransferase family 87